MNLQWILYLILINSTVTLYKNLKMFEREDFWCKKTEKKNFNWKFFEFPIHEVIRKTNRTVEEWRAYQAAIVKYQRRERKAGRFENKISYQQARLAKMN